ncbi:MAG: hypothetical protein M1833_003000 [Piccolia ochrophora]|nr:MAG: hypothetical protein M1833_003000 [Piccolia ochrophora]
MESERNHSFQRVVFQGLRSVQLLILPKLKPSCVELSRIALTFERNQYTNQHLVTALSDLLRTLESLRSHGTLFDIKLAEYVFFPLSHVFRQSKLMSQRALELALNCLTYLLSEGWGPNIPDDLGKQLLILLTFTAEGKATKEQSAPVSEELLLAAFRCLSALFSCYAESHKDPGLAEAANVPALGHAVTVMLEGIQNGPSAEVQLSAASALTSCQVGIFDREILATFLPGVVSSLGKVLHRDTRSRRSSKLFVTCLKLLSSIIRRVFDDLQRKTINDDSHSAADSPSVYKTRLTTSWLKATAAQVKFALANVVKLQDYERVEVRRSLHGLCYAILSKCRTTLAGCIPLMVETLLNLAGEATNNENDEDEEALKELAASDPSILDAIKNSLHIWVVSLPRVMQSNNDQEKRQTIVRMSTSLRLLSELGVELDMVDAKLSANLRDSVSAAIQSSIGKGIAPSQSLEFLPSLENISAAGAKPSTDFGAIVIASKSQKQTMIEFHSLLERLSASSSSLTITADMLDYIRGDDGIGQLAGFWLALNTMKHAFRNTDPLSDLVDLDPQASATKNQLLEELYFFSITVLQNANPTEGQDWRLRGLALEAIALQAQQLKTDFRPELIEALYPVVHLLASSHPQLQQHAMTCLNILAEACGYSSTSEIILENVDYLINAVALKLNTFDISPHAPQVLLMMIKLSGPTLIPSLDDLIGSIFAALDSFHGYPRLVELLFSVLRAIVDEGAKFDARTITSGPAPNHRKPPVKPKTIDDAIAQLRAYTERAAKRAVPDDTSASDTQDVPFPTRPWGEEASPSSSPPPSGPDLTDDPPTPSKTHTLLLRIATLMQHHLTSPSPALRLLLLNLLTTSFPLLSHDETTFLPLLNALWPVLLPRLTDPAEPPFVVVAAAETLATACECAGDFLASRVDSEGWSGVKTVMTRIRGVKRGKGKEEGKGKEIGKPGGRGVYAAESKIWDALVGLVVSILRHVRVRDAMVDEIMEAVGVEEVKARKDLREALEERNADAVWLALMRSGDRVVGHAPQVEGWEFREVEV